jgi:HAD superfamily hydrolase (TIGR01549 family)
MAQQIETLLFDFGGTLDADGVAWKERFRTHYRAEGLDMTAETFAPIFYAADGPLVGDLPLDADLSKTVHGLTANLEAELARRNGDAAKHHVEDDRGERVAARFLSEASIAFARNRPLLEALRGRYRLGVVSNFYGNLEAVCHGASLAHLFGVIVDSHRVGAEKPDPAIFRAALEPLCAKAETTLFVGDSFRRDREGARRIGMGFLWIAPRDVQASAVRAAEGPLDHSAIARLGDLAEILV